MTKRASHPRRKSIKGWLILIVVVSQGLLAAGWLLGGILYTRRVLLSTLDLSIQARARTVAALVRYTEDANGTVYFENSLVPPPLDPSHPDLYAIWTERSGLLVHSANWTNAVEAPSGRDRWFFDLHDVHYRGLRLTRVPILDREDGDTFRPQMLTVVYASPTFRLNQQVRQSGLYIALSGILLLSGTVLLSLWGVRRGLMPLQVLAERAALVSTQNWELHLPDEVQGLKELRPLAGSMKTMLDRLHHSFDQQNEFLGNTAHELKTPVAVMKSTLQSILQRPRTSDEYRAGVERSLEDLARLERLLQWILQLARAEQWARGALHRDLEFVNIVSTCEDAVDRIRSLAESRNTIVDLSTNGPVLFRADPEDLQLVWVNLLENAIRYSPPGGRVRVVVFPEADCRAQVVVEDHGFGIDSKQLPRIFDRFYRGDPSRNPTTRGFGLGLAIVKALLESYGGTIIAESVQGKGTRMTVSLPVESASPNRNIAVY